MTDSARTVYLNIGSNLEPEKNIPACLEILKKKFQVKKISSIYETDAVGMQGAKFWNLAVAIEIQYDIKNLIEVLHRIEDEMGRKRDPGNKFSPRTIDLDIVPQPGYQKQAFIMVPLAEIAPEEMDEESGKSLMELAGLVSRSGVRKVR